MVWQPAEGGEAVSATEWSRVVAGDEDVASADPSRSTGGADRPRPRPPRSAAEPTRPPRRADGSDEPVPTPADAPEHGVSGTPTATAEEGSA